MMTDSGPRPTQDTTPALTERQKQQLRHGNPNWAYDMCCGEPFNCGGCYVDAMTGA